MPISFNVEKNISKAGRSVEELLEDLLPEVEGPESELFEAMRYSVLSKGKRLRAFLIISCADLFDASDDQALRVAAALELLHAYSLIHDDLPCMDDSTLRRGQPSCHVKYGEATAVLAGDALQALAFEVLADPKTHSDASVRCRLISSLAIASGANGMVGGQMLDLINEHNRLDISMITRLQHLKTGALITFTGEAASLLGFASRPKRNALKAYTQDLGLAYQITDDLLDLEGSEESTGKNVQKDHNRGKATYVSALGEEKARLHLDILTQQALKHLDIFGEKANLLREFVTYIVERKR